MPLLRRNPSNAMGWLLSTVIDLGLFFVLEWLYQALREDSELDNANRRRKTRTSAVGPVGSSRLVFRVKRSRDCRASRRSGMPS
jgi:hypothetical protein